MIFMTLGENSKMREYEDLLKECGAVMTQHFGEDVSVVLFDSKSVTKEEKQQIIYAAKEQDKCVLDFWNPYARDEDALIEYQLFKQFNKEEKMNLADKHYGIFERFTRIYCKREIDSYDFYTSYIDSYQDELRAIKRNEEVIENIADRMQDVFDALIEKNEISFVTDNVKQEVFESMLSKKIPGSLMEMIEKRVDEKLAEKEEERDL